MVRYYVTEINNHSPYTKKKEKIMTFTFVKREKKKEEVMMCYNPE